MEMLLYYLKMVVVIRTSAVGVGIIYSLVKIDLGFLIYVWNR
jgi:hypothetical protein